MILVCSKCKHDVWDFDGQYVICRYCGHKILVRKVKT